ncbi:MAG: hypothetical protein KDB58_05195 [Solirubrobacterales bacterium]|nr:hypothetical protein [Solirubrobacterales bacterium]MCB8970530.1 hypothetical protein [Thermoleophilales bacterium]MCO5325690.1 hypothetical protein [Solirubrobacterales bacterium]
MAVGGSANSTLDRAIANGNVRQIEIAAIACDFVPLHQALAICLVYLRSAPDRYDAAASRFLERLIAEHRPPIGMASTIAAALAAAPHPAALSALASCLKALGLERAGAVVRAQGTEART